jgi:hypothetical protein
MTGSKPNIFMLVCWKFVSPALLLFILIMSMVDQFTTGDTYAKYDKTIASPGTAYLSISLVLIGYVLLLFIVVWVPLQAGLKYVSSFILKCMFIFCIILRPVVEHYEGIV